MTAERREWGQGRVFKRGETYWISYCVRGKEIRESAKTIDEIKAWRKLRQRLKERERPNFVGPSEERLTLGDLEGKILADYVKNQRRSTETMQDCLKHVKRFFALDRLVDITAERIEAYQTARLGEGAKRATVNRELAYLRRGFRLLVADGALSRMPTIRLLQGEAVRQGFVNRSDFDALLGRLPAEDRDIVAFLYHSGWRSGEAKSLQWRDVDMEAGMIRLRSENSKNKKSRILPMVGELRAIIERQAKERRLDCLFVFHRNGKPIKSFRKAFTSAATAIGMPQLIPHDLRRSAVRNFRRAGISETEGMMLSGHKTNSIYKRYDIVDENDLREAAERVQAFLEQERTRKVVSMGSKG